MIGQNLKLGFVLAALILGAMLDQGHTSEVFTSAAKVLECFNLEKDLSSKIDVFIAEQEERLANLKDLKERLANQTVPDGDTVMSPGDGFSVINRLYSALSEINHVVRPDGELVKWIAESRKKLPDKDDHVGSAAAILRLQRIYERSPQELLPNADAADYLFVAKQAYDQRDWVSALEWLKLALEEAKAEDSKEVIISTLDHMAYTYYKLDFFELAVNTSLDLLQVDPTNYRVEDNLVLYRRKFAKQTEEPVLNTTRVHPEDNLLQHSEEEMIAYRALCRGEKLRKSNNMTCTTISTGNPLLRLRPARVDWITDGVVGARVFRDFISDAEADHLIAVGKERLKRSLAHNGKEFVETSYRISEVGWIDPELDDILKRIHRRIAAVTGLDLRSAEQLQISNYGIGGHYEPHLDAGRTVQEVGARRLATFMMYLNDVEAGGHTVYPRLGVGNGPSKRDAIFWYNLDESGTPNPDTLHAGCPVLQGSKWVANKWIHHLGN